jgi:uncharacterized membrane protein YgcG
VSLLVAFRVSVAEARELHWRELSVSARLDDEGRLHVSERHQMVFTGDWNGGERTFRVSKGQHLELEGMTRVDADGTRTSVVEGDLTDVDEYALQEHTLRWRSRLPSSAPFDHREIGYVIDYILSDILVPSGPGQFTLDHEFAFLERPGDIERFALHLELDPVWGSDQKLPIEYEAGPLHAFQGFALKLPLDSRGNAYPPSLWKRAWRILRAVDPINLGLAAAFVAVVLGWVTRRLRSERNRGLFLTLPKESEIDRTWIEAHVLAMKPELAGVARDVRVGSSDVAALLARLEQEGKIASVVRAGSPNGTHYEDLELELLVPRDQFTGYERKLVDQFFFGGTRTSSESLRRHYARSGFYPASSLREPLSEALVPLLGPGKYGAATSSRVFPMIALGMLTFSVALACAVFHAAATESSVVAAMGGVLGGTALYAAGIFVAVRVYGNVVAPSRPWRWHVAWFGAWTAVCVALLVGMNPSGVVSALILFFGLSVGRAMLWVSSSPESAEGVALRKCLAAARRHFEAELKKPEPQLDDAWFPYLIALGLSPQLDHWFRGFGGQATRRGTRTSRSESSSSGISRASEPASEPSGWTGGGGIFGGGGASGSWLGAAESLAAGVARPSSGSSGSGSSSSGSSSSSSSGGGSGGGW